MANDLSAPLQSRKTRRAAARQARRGLPWGRIGAGLIVLALGVVGARLVFFADPDGGRPMAEAEIAVTREANSVASTVGTAPATPMTITADPQQLPATAGAAPATPSESTPSADNRFGVLPDLVEETEYGAIPRMSATGVTPFEAYRSTIAPVAGTASISIIVVGLGINEAGSLDAIERLPEGVSLAFAPYGRALGDVVAAARSDGHEIFLEIPLEPFDYPDNDPGPQTLLTGEEPRANLDKLFWLLSRFGGYVGVINNMGARFTAAGADFEPVMEELGLRGLGYLDDGSSNRSIAPQLASGNAVPFARADLTIDANPDRSAILNQLAELENRATQGGSAIGIVSALPVSIATIAEWAETLEAKNIMLLPASALMQ